jgi:hypothetical protein
MCNYIKFCADQLLIALGCNRYYKISNLFEWMETISLQGKTNFFKKRIREYSISGVGVDRTKQTFALDASFWSFLTHTSTLLLCSSIITCHILLCFQLEHQPSPPIPTPFYFRGFTENKYHRCGRRMSTKVQRVFEQEKACPSLCPKAKSPSGSVMIIYLSIYWNGTTRNTMWVLPCQLMSKNNSQNTVTLLP